MFVLSFISLQFTCTLADRLLSAWLLRCCRCALPRARPAAPCSVVTSKMHCLSREHLVLTPQQAIVNTHSLSFLSDSCTARCQTRLLKSLTAEMPGWLPFPGSSMLGGIGRFLPSSVFPASVIWHATMNISLEC